MYIELPDAGLAGMAWMQGPLPTSGEAQVFARARATAKLVTRLAARVVFLTTLCEVLHGEFDPGSGRTLAACLTHASGATNQASAWGKAANG